MIPEAKLHNLRVALAARDREIERLRDRLALADEMAAALEKIASCEPVEGKAAKNRGNMLRMQALAKAALANWRAKEVTNGYFEDYCCGCVSPVVRLKRELPGYCPKHGDNRRHVHRVHPHLDKAKW